MKISKMTKSVLLLLCFTSQFGYAEENVATTEESQTEIEKDVNLEKELESLNMPVNQGPANASIENLYSVQTRLMPLTRKHEITLNVGKNMNAGGLLNSEQIGGTYRYHVNDKFSFGVGGYKVFNEISTDGKDVLRAGRIVNPKDYVSQQYEAHVSYNLFYGKFRLGLNRVFYFDQYLSLGAGIAELASGNTQMISPEIGLAFWMGTMGSIRLGVRNELYNEQTLDGESLNHNLVTYLGIGILFGGK